VLLIVCFVECDREVRFVDWSGLGFRGVCDSICECSEN